jgi:transposase-like protein
MLTLAERAKEAIKAAKENGFSVKQIAKACGIKDKAVYQWRNGSTQSIDGGNLVELAAMSGYRAAWIAKEKGPKRDTKEILQAIELMQRMTPQRQADVVMIIAPFAEQNKDSTIDKKGGPTDVESRPISNQKPIPKTIRPPTIRPRH